MYALLLYSLNQEEEQTKVLDSAKATATIGHLILYGLNEKKAETEAIIKKLTSADTVPDEIKPFYARSCINVANAILNAVYKIEETKKGIEIKPNSFSNTKSDCLEKMAWR